ncbi:hypothetical protein ACFR9U_04450 [Halorientalis brevis]|uniref:Uncharacterized protein n=1 Tax=Halorientalis brevis TaxID=1126241 RepID=A0ABD6C7U2_9EURY|nr:hypothetical protein [Halorientalis brevis]
MILSFEGTIREGRALDVRDLDLTAAAVVAAVRGRESSVDVTAPEHGSVHERVGHVRPGMGLSTRTALAAAARSRGLSAPQDEQLAAVRAELSTLDCPSVSTRAERRSVSEQGAETERLRERVAALRGRVQAARERGDDTEELEAELAAAVRDLSEAETERVAARERFDAARDAAREARDVREQRLKLADRRANLERAARAHLVEQVDTEYAEAVAAVPGRTPTNPYEADGVTAALAVGRVAALNAPVVLDCDRFDSPEAAASWLDAPVVRL